MEHLHSPEEIRRRILQICLSPQARGIVEIAKNDKVSSQSFAEVISAEPLFAARLLRVANLACGPSQRITTATQALNVFGLNNLKLLALGLSAFALPPWAEGKNSPEPSPTLRNLWEHSLGCAAVAGQLVSRFEKSRLHAFVTGFIHDIGRLLLYRVAEEDFSQAVRISEEKSIPATEAEILAFGTSHVAVAAEWAEKSELPDFFRCILRLHHERPAMLASDLDVETRHCILLVQAADSICHAARIGEASEGAKPGCEVWSELGIERGEWSDQARAIKSAIVAARDAFGFVKTSAQQDQPRQHPVREVRAAMSGARGTVIPFPRSAAVVEPPPLDPSVKPSILVVEDHNSLCDLLSLYLMRYGYHVRTASNGEGALEILARKKFTCCCWI